MRIKHLILVLVFLGIFPLYAVGVEIKATGDWSYPVNAPDIVFDGLDEPVLKKFPLVIYLSLRAKQVYSGSQARGLTSFGFEGEAYMPCYWGMLLVKEDYTVIFIRGKNYHEYTPNPGVDILDFLLSMQGRVTNWDDLANYLNGMRSRGVIMVLAAPGEAPDMEFVPRFTDTYRLTTYDALKQRALSKKQDESGKELVNAKKGMRIIKFKEVWDDGSEVKIK